MPNSSGKMQIRPGQSPLQPTLPELPKNTGAYPKSLPPLTPMPFPALADNKLGDVSAMLRLLDPLASSTMDKADRSRRLLADFCRLVGAQAGKASPPVQPRVPDDLPPRLGQTLRLLLAGDSEKQVALKLQLSRHTIHSYVKSLYRKYDVSSRAELLAKFLNK